jgi:hypothetical protein
VGDEHQLSVALDDEHAETLRRLARRAEASEEELAGSLLSLALDDADSDPRRVTELLDGIPGAFERAELGREQAREGSGTPVEEL